eukprot:362561-Chlamydomonas_euryale.AAC.4
MFADTYFSQFRQSNRGMQRLDPQVGAVGLANQPLVGCWLRWLPAARLAGRVEGWEGMSRLLTRLHAIPAVLAC